MLNGFLGTPLTKAFRMANLAGWAHGEAAPGGIDRRRFNGGNDGKGGDIGKLGASTPHHCGANRARALTEGRADAVKGAVNDRGAILTGDRLRHHDGRGRAH